MYDIKVWKLSYFLAIHDTKYSNTTTCPTLPSNSYTIFSKICFCVGPHHKWAVREARSCSSIRASQARHFGRGIRRTHAQNCLQKTLSFSYFNK